LILIYKHNIFASKLRRNEPIFKDLRILFTNLKVRTEFALFLYKFVLILANRICQSQGTERIELQNLNAQNNPKLSDGQL
jgi:hypothetical protein